jgi:protease IV
MGWVVYGVRWVVWGGGSLLRRWRSGPAWIYLVVDGALPAFDPPREPLWRRFLMPRGGPSLRELATRLRRLAGDDRVQGVVLHLRPVPMASADAAALAGLVSEVRGAGKRVICWATGYTAGTYQVACAANQVLLQPGGVIGPLGVSRTYVFLKEALTRVGVEADVIQVSPYKTAGDLLARRTLTPEAREMADWLADSEIEERLATIAAGRRLDAAQAQALLDESPLTDTRALELGAIDASCSEEALPERLGSEPVPWESVRRRLSRARPIPPGRCVGLLRIEGAIIDGQSQHPPVSPPIPLPLLLQEQAGDLTVVQQARRLARSRRVAAVVLWIDSPGGSATASEAMAAALQALARRKPLVAVMGAVAGSGGYYVATPARRIFAQPGTLTGSIGVITTKVAIGGLLRRLLIGHQVIARGAYSGMEDPGRPYSDAERAKVREIVDRLYGLFLDRVAESRGRPVGEIEPIAGGRVWTGRQALARGLVDELGGVDRALAEARRLGGVRDDAPLIELGGRGAVAPAATGTAALVLSTIRALCLAPAWLMCPLLDADLIGLPGD